jgi:hypothetical protein
MSHPFEVGKTYRNRKGEYIVQAIDGDHMTIRYVSGGTLETSVAIQARIWENIHFEYQMEQEEEKRRLAREARLEARKRKARAKKALAEPKYGGFQESDFEPKKRGIAWSGREQAGKALAYQLKQRIEEDFGSWIVPRQSQVHVARKEHYDFESRDTNAAFFVAVDEKGVKYGFRAGKPGGKEKVEWPWLTLIAVLAEDKKVRRAFRAAMKEHELALDVYVEEVSYHQVGQILLEGRGFLWQHETADQEMTRKMNWNQLVEYLQTVAPKKRCDLYLCKQVSAEVALELGAGATEEICGTLESLMPIYDASVGA